MIVTLTANPSLDRTITLERDLRVGEVQTAASVREDAGGKGVNVARVIRAAGHDARAVLPLDPGDPLSGLLRAEGIVGHSVPVTGAARANVTIVGPRGLTTKVNLPGVVRTSRDATAMIDAVIEECADAQWLVLAGSVPAGLPSDFYVSVIDAVRAALPAPPRIAVDTSGEALRAVVAEGAPDVIKPNDEELAELAGRSLDGSLPLSHTVAAIARTLVPSRVGSAFVTLGAAGAVLVTADGAWHGTPPPTHVRNTVGAGDSALAGYLLADVAGANPQERLRHGIRYGSAAASLPGTQAPTPADLLPGDVVITPISH